MNASMHFIHSYTSHGLRQESLSRSSTSQTNRSSAGRTAGTRSQPPLRSLSYGLSAWNNRAADVSHLVEIGMRLTHTIRSELAVACDQRDRDGGKRRAVWLMRTPDR